MPISDLCLIMYFMHMYFLFMKSKQLNPTVLGYAETPDGHFRRVQNESPRFTASAHHRPLEHFDRMQPATRLIGTFTRKVSLTFIYLFIYLFTYLFILLQQSRSSFKVLQSTIKIK